MSYLPTFRPQNPALNGDPEGWSSCTAYSASMAGDFDTLGAQKPTGRQIRGLTGDHTGGLNLAQVDAALLEGWNINLATIKDLPWADFAKKIIAGCGAILDGGYGPIADSRFDAGGGFRGNHAIFVAPGFIGMDPLADGRRAGIYKFHGEAYPTALLKDFAGRLDLGNGNKLGSGLVYASFTRDNVHTFHLSFLGGAFFIYKLNPDGSIKSRVSKTFNHPTGAPCSAPRFHPWVGYIWRSLVLIEEGLLAGEYVGIGSPSVKLEVVP
jgi:hypothetical protein